MPIFRLVERLFLAAGLIMLLFAVYRAYDQFAFGPNAAGAEGIVTDLVRDRRPSLAYRVVFATVVRYQGVNGEWYQFAEPVSSNPPPYQRGERVPVLYDPVAPDRAGIDGFLCRLFVPTPVTGLGVVLLVLGSVVLSSRMSERVRDRLQQFRQTSPQGEA